MINTSFFVIADAVIFPSISLGSSMAAVEEPVLELYIHDILGGSSPTARPITGLLGNIYGGQCCQVPFARSIVYLPPKGGVAIPNPNGVVPTVSGRTGVPLGTGLTGTNFTGIQAQRTVAGNSNNNIVSTQLGLDGLGLGFGAITVINDVITSSPELGFQSTQRVYMVSSADGTSQMMTFTAMLEGGEYGDTLNFYGIYKVGNPMSLRLGLWLPPGKSSLMEQRPCSGSPSI